MNLKKLFQPKSLAVVGGYWTDFVIEGNRKLGFKGPIWHINPTRISNDKFCLIITKYTHHPINKKSRSWVELIKSEMFHLDLEKTFLKAFTIESIKSFLAKR